MQVRFSDAEFGRCMAHKETLLQAFGSQIGLILMRRMCELRAVKTLGDLRRMPHIRIREINDQNSFQLSVQLHDGSELTIEPFDHINSENQIDWDAVNEITVLKVTLSTHHL
jgi:hypothetical protein